MVCVRRELERPTRAAMVIFGEEWNVRVEARPRWYHPRRREATIPTRLFPTPNRPARKRLVAALALGAVAVTAVACRRPGDPEADRLLVLLNLPRQATIAEIGAGDGALTMAIAKRAGSSVTVYSTELGKRQVVRLWLAAAAAGAWNVRVVKGSATDTRLPPGSCDAVFMRRVYHHFMKPAEMDASLFRTIRPRGVLAVIDQQPTPYNFFDVLPSRGGDGIRPEMLVKELGEAGFHHVRTIDRWRGDLYLALFGRP